MSHTTDDAPPAVARPALAAGTVIDGRYRIESRLGAGGAGTVFRCIDLELGAPVALKVLAADADLARWRREVALARKITDRNVCRVHDLGDTAELRFVTMELVEGVGLRDKIGRLSPSEARDLIAQLVAGTAAIHAAGIIHRDLKPENVVVEPSGRLVIVDFGIAKTPTSTQVTRPHAAVAAPGVNLTQAGIAIGTPRYMSPEQAVGEAVDARADVWALGLIAHELLAGGLPPLGSYGPIVDDALDAKWPGGAAILRKCLAFEAADRYDNAGAIRIAIANLTTQQSAASRSTGPSASRTVDLRTPGSAPPPPDPSELDPPTERYDRAAAARSMAKPAPRTVDLRTPPSPDAAQLDPPTTRLDRSSAAAGMSAAAKDRAAKPFDRSSVAAGLSAARSGAPPSPDAAQLDPPTTRHDRAAAAAGFASARSAPPPPDAAQLDPPTVRHDRSSAAAGLPPRTPPLPDAAQLDPPTTRHGASISELPPSDPIVPGASISEPVLPPSDPIVPGGQISPPTESDAARARASRVRRDAIPPASRMPLSRLAKILFAIAAVGVIAAISFLVIKAVRGSKSDEPPGPTTPVVPDSPSTPISMTQLTTTAEAQWPEASPTSVALDPTGSKLAYTSGDGKLHVRPLAGGATTDWPAPTVKPHDTALTLGSPRVIGWFSDGALAVVGSTTSSVYLIRMRPDGSSDRLFDSPERFRAAVSPGGKIAIADRTSIHELAGDPHGTTGSDDVIALAWIGEKQLAWIQLTSSGATGDASGAVSIGDATLVVDGKSLWTGRTELLIDPLLASIGDRIVFSTRDNGRTKILSIDPATKNVTTIDELAAHVGGGSAAKDTLVLVKGESREAVQIRDRYGNRAVLAHDANVRGTDVAGYTPDGAVVFRAGTQIVSAQPADKNKSWQVTPWPKTAPTDLPVAVAGPDLIVREASPASSSNGSSASSDSQASGSQAGGSQAPATWKLSRITPDGTRTPLAPLAHAVGLHCAASREPSQPASCVAQQRDGGDTFSEFDPATGTLGRQIFHHQTYAAGFGLSPTLLVLTAGATVLPIDRATGTAMMKPYPASISTRWRAVAIDDAGDLWTSAEPLEAAPYRFAKARASSAGSDAKDGWSRPSNLVLQKPDALRWFGEAAIRGTESDLRIAVATTELRLEIWRADHLAN